MNPVFPKKESELAAALMQWEAEVRAYERETVKIFDKDTAHAVLQGVAPESFQTTIALHIESLNAYEKLRQYIENYLVAKKMWKRLGGSGFGSARVEHWTSTNNVLGHKKALMQADPENSTKAVPNMFQEKLGAERVSARMSPRESHHSLGEAESTNGHIAAMISTWLVALNQDYKGVTVSHLLFA